MSLEIFESAPMLTAKAAERELVAQARAGADGHVLASLADVLLSYSAAEPTEDDSASMFITDRDGLILWVNAAFTRLTGYAFDEAVGRNARLLSSGQQGRRFYRRMWECISSGQVWTAETVDRDRYGFRYVIEQSIYPLSHAGEITHYLSVHRDAADQRVRRLEAERRREVDTGTGLLTGTAFLDRVGDRVRQAETANRYFALISVQFAREGLDLKACAVTLRAQLGRADCAGHFGDGHVGVLVNDMANARGACAWIEQTLKPVCTAHEWQAGVAIYPDHGVRADHLWRIADDNILARAS